MRRPRAPFRDVAGALGEASLPLMIPIILLGGILTGWFTPTEAGVVAIVYILLVVIPLLNPTHLRHVPRDFVQAGVKSKHLKRGSTLLYLAGADLARDLAGELGEKGFTVVTHTTYRMIPVSSLPREVCDAFVANEVEAVLHYSRRSARAFLDAARTGGVEISALALPQYCISAAVASILRDAGAAQVTAAASADENALFEALVRALRP